MAELILTDDEKNAGSFLDFDDASLGRCVKALALNAFAEKVEKIKIGVEGSGPCYIMAATQVLASFAHETNAGEASFEVCGLSFRGKPVGDWLIEIRRK